MDLVPGREGGTWLGVTKDGKFAALTNYTQAQEVVISNAIGRGYLVSDFLKGSDSVKEYLQRISDEADNYKGFNLLLGQLSLHGKTVMGYYGNIEERWINMLSPGIHVLSNKTLNCSWPKMVYGRKRFSEILDESCSKQVLVDKLIELLCAQERSFNSSDGKSFTGSHDDRSNENFMDDYDDLCRSIFVKNKEKRYGTRTNTVLLVDAKGHVTYVERTMEDATDPDEAEWRINKWEFDMQDTDNC